MNICTGSYDIPVAYLSVDGVYTNKAPGGVAYRCSFRVTEAAYFIERMIEVLAIKLGMDAAVVLPYRSMLLYTRSRETPSLFVTDSMMSGLAGSLILIPFWREVSLFFKRHFSGYLNFKSN